MDIDIETSWHVKMSKKIKREIKLFVLLIYGVNNIGRQAFLNSPKMQKMLNFCKKIPRQNKSGRARVAR